MVQTISLEHKDKGDAHSVASDEPAPLLTRTTIHTGLSQISRAADGKGFAFGEFGASFSSPRLTPRPLCSALGSPWPGNPHTRG